MPEFHFHSKSLKKVIQGLLFWRGVDTNNKVCEKICVSSWCRLLNEILLNLFSKALFLNMRINYPSS